jgi:elongation factor Ts
MIDALEVKKLREMTGLGIMDCKNALVKANGDPYLAMEHLRHQNRKIEKRASRETSQGTIASLIGPEGSYGIMLELNCESDFVANTYEFKTLAQTLLTHASETNLWDEEDLRDDVTAKSLIEAAIVKMGENITVGRLVRIDLKRDNAR